MLKLLIPVDGSDCSVRAVEYAIRLAREHGPVSIRLLNVYYEPVRLGDVGIAVTPEQMAAVERRQTDPALATAERLLREAGVAYERDLRAGDVAPTIVAHAEAAGCDAILMGSHGAGALAGLVMGSVAMKVVAMARIPVTVVK